MHMIAIGWLWVVFMMAISEKNIVSGAMTFIFYGLVPCAVLLYLLNKQAGRRRLHQAQMRAQMREQEKAGERPVEATQAPSSDTQPPAPRA
jgi:hypothetical protein